MRGSKTSYKQNKYLDNYKQIYLSSLTGKKQNKFAICTMIHNTPCFRHKILHTLCFFFHLSWVQMSQEKLEDNGFAKFWESVLWEMSKWQISISL